MLADTAHGYRSNGRRQYSGTSQPPVNATEVWNYGEYDSRHAQGVREKPLDGAGSVCAENACVPEENWHRSGSGGGGSKHTCDSMPAVVACQQEALGPQEAGIRSHKQWMLSMGAERGAGSGTAADHFLQPARWMQAVCL